MRRVVSIVILRSVFCQPMSDLINSFSPVVSPAAYLYRWTCNFSRNVACECSNISKEILETDSDNFNQLKRYFNISKTINSGPNSQLQKQCLIPGCPRGSLPTFRTCPVCQHVDWRCLMGLYMIDKLQRMLRNNPFPKLFSVPTPMATQYGSGARPPPRPSPNQASRAKSTKISAARCRVFTGQKLSHRKVADVQWQPKYTPARNCVAFGYSAGISAASVSMSSTNTARQTAQAQPVYGRNAASCLHFLKRKIKLTIFKIDSASHDLESGIGSLNSKVSLYAQNLDNKIQQVNASKDAHADVVREFERLKGEQDSYAHDLDMKIMHLKKSHDDVVNKIEFLNIRKDEFDYNSANMMKIFNASKTLDSHDLDRKNKLETLTRINYHRSMDRRIQSLTDAKDAYAYDLDQQVKLQNAKALSDADDLDKQIKLLSARKDELVQDLVRQVQLVNARSDSHAYDLQRKMDLLNQQITSYQHEIRRQSELVDSRKTPFAQDLDRQLKLLDSKLAEFYHDLEKQCVLLNSNINSYFTDVYEKKELLNRSIASYLEISC